MTVEESLPRSRWSLAADRLLPTRPDAEADKRLPWTVLVLGLVVLVLVASGALFFVLNWVDGVADPKVKPDAAIAGKDFVTAKLDAVKITLSAVAGGVALFALYLAVRRQMTAERDLRARLDAQAHSEDDAGARRVTELYTKAADQLDSHVSVTSTRRHKAGIRTSFTRSSGRRRFEWAAAEAVRGGGEAAEVGQRRRCCCARCPARPSPLEVTVLPR